MLLQWKQRNKSVWGDFILHFELYSEWEQQNSIFIVTSPGKAQDRRKRNLLNRRRAEDKHENFTFKASLFLSKKSNFSWAQKGSSSKEGATRNRKKVDKWWFPAALEGELCMEGKIFFLPKKDNFLPWDAQTPGTVKSRNHSRIFLWFFTPGFFSGFSHPALPGFVKMLQLYTRFMYSRLLLRGVSPNSSNPAHPRWK